MPRPKRTIIIEDIDRPYWGIGQRIREFRLSKGLDQADLADKCDVSPVTVSRVENGLQQPSIKLLHCLHADYGADLNDIVVGSGE